MDFSPEDSSALFSQEARMQQETAAFVCVLSHCSPALVWRTPSRLGPQTHSDLPTNCWNQLGEPPKANTFHQPSDGNNPFQLMSLQAGREKAPDFILNPSSYSFYPHSTVLGRVTFPYMVKKKWRVSAIHSHIRARLSQASMSL